MQNELSPNHAVRTIGTLSGPLAIEINQMRDNAQPISSCGSNLNLEQECPCNFALFALIKWTIQ